MSPLSEQGQNEKKTQVYPNDVRVDHPQHGATGEKSILRGPGEEGVPGQEATHGHPQQPDNSLGDVGIARSTQPDTHQLKEGGLPPTAPEKTPAQPSTPTR